MLQEVQETDYTKGAVLRWALQATDSDRLQLCLLGLPAAENYVRRKANLRRDSCPAIVLGIIKLTADYHSAGTIRGPKPILFSTDPTKTTEILQKDPARAYPGNTND